MLLRHAKSAWPENVPDRDRPLSPRGRRDAPAAGRWLRQAGCTPDDVRCSTSRRARETWQLVQGELGAQPAVVFEPDVYEASTSSLLDLLRRLPSASVTVLVVGHYPALPDLAVVLAGQNAADSREVSGLAPGTALGRMQAKFPTAAIAVLAVDGPWSELAAGRALLTSFVTPREKYRGDRGQLA